MLDVNQLEQLLQSSFVTALFGGLSKDLHKHQNLMRPRHPVCNCLCRTAKEADMLSQWLDKSVYWWCHSARLCLGLCSQPHCSLLYLERCSLLSATAHCHCSFSAHALLTTLPCSAWLSHIILTDWLTDWHSTKSCLTQSYRLVSSAPSQKRLLLWMLLDKAL